MSLKMRAQHTAHASYGTLFHQKTVWIMCHLPGVRINFNWGIIWSCVTMICIISLVVAFLQFGPSSILRFYQGCEPQIQIIRWELHILKHPPHRKKTHCCHYTIILLHYTLLLYNLGPEFVQQSLQIELIWLKQMRRGHARISGACNCMQTKILHIYIYTQTHEKK